MMRKVITFFATLIIISLVCINAFILFVLVEERISKTPRSPQHLKETYEKLKTIDLQPKQLIEVEENHFTPVQKKQEETKPIEQRPERPERESKPVEEDAQQKRKEVLGVPIIEGQTNFENCTELRRVYPDGVPKGHPAYRPDMDRDKDDWACETSK